MPDTDPAKRQQLLDKIKKLSISWGDFTLSSGAKSKYYFDCRLTTLDPEGACLVGDQMHDLIRAEARRRNAAVEAVGGLTMGADPIALAIGMTSWMKDPQHAINVFTVRKAPKAHGQTKLIEGNFRAGMRVVVLDDVVTKGESTMKAIEAVEAAGGIVSFVAVLVDREEGGCDRIREKGHHVLSLFKRSDLIPEEALAPQAG
ncbi:MAG TPA: orotate phosphoribosyltransferase [Chthoniobacteraceae bacterium]|nr:orotate phosphoribosyltransferase [Chthoniobacteraceae bacterium]